MCRVCLYWAHMVELRFKNSVRWQWATRRLQTSDTDLSSESMFLQVTMQSLSPSSSTCSCLFLIIAPCCCLSFDMLLIWQVKVSFVASTSAFILLSAPSVQWCRSHMLLFHETVMLLLLLMRVRQHHLLFPDHNLDKDRMRCHLPPSHSTLHSEHSCKWA